jgi:hypothetical protein
MLNEVKHDKVWRGGRHGSAMNNLNLSHQVPLNFSQKARLMVECLPVVFWTAALIFCATLLDDFIGAPAPPALLIFLGLVIVVTGWAALNRVRDLTVGVALVQEDLLTRSWRSRGAGTKPFHGQFERLGRMRLTSEAYGQSQNGVRYRVCYSPASKIVWRLETI